MPLNKMAAEWQKKLMADLFAFLGEGTLRENHRAWVGPEGGPRFYLRHSNIVHRGVCYQGIVLANHECEESDKFKWFVEWLEKVCVGSKVIQAVEVESVMESWVAGHLVMHGWEVKDTVCPNNVTLVKKVS